MRSTIVLPHILLQPYVQAYVWSHVEAGNNEPFEMDLSPSGYGVLSFILNEKYCLKDLESGIAYSNRFRFTGQLKNYRRFLVSPTSIVLILFKPFGAYKLLGLPQQLFINQSIATRQFLNKKQMEIYPQLEDNANNPYVVMNLLEQWLLNQLQQLDRLDVSRIAVVCEEIMRHSGHVSIKALGKKIGMSKSSLETHFNEKVGVGPKSFSRIHRLNIIYNILQNPSGADWKELADKFGYYDHAHFINDFKHFCGCTPAKFYSNQQSLSGHLSKVIQE